MCYANDVQETIVGRILIVRCKFTMEQFGWKKWQEVPEELLRAKRQPRHMGR
jgi:hypothetical protein